MVGDIDVFHPLMKLGVMREFGSSLVIAEDLSLTDVDL